MRSIECANFDVGNILTWKLQLKHCTIRLQVHKGFKKGFNTEQDRKQPGKVNEILFGNLEIWNRD